MIKPGIIKLGDVIFIYSQPIEHALVGVVKDIKYPLLYVSAINRQVEKTVESEKIVDIMKEDALTILGKDKIKKILTTEEQKKLNKVRKSVSEMANDIFG